MSTVLKPLKVGTLFSAASMMTGKVVQTDNMMPKYLQPLLSRRQMDMREIERMFKSGQRILMTVTGTNVKERRIVPMVKSAQHYLLANDTNEAKAFVPSWIEHYVDGYAKTKLLLDAVFYKPEDVEDNSSFETPRSTEDLLAYFTGGDQHSLNVVTMDGQQAQLSKENAMYDFLFWWLVLAGFDNCIFNEQLSWIVDAAYLFGFDDKMFSDWARAAAFVISGKPLYDQADLICDSFEAQMFFLHRGAKSKENFNPEWTDMAKMFGHS